MVPVWINTPQGALNNFSYTTYFKRKAKDFFVFRRAKEIFRRVLYLAQTLQYVFVLQKQFEENTFQFIFTHKKLFGRGP